jgi:hypothetical protein
MPPESVALSAVNPSRTLTVYPPTANMEMHRMKFLKVLCPIVILLAITPIAVAQGQKITRLRPPLPNLMLIVHQQILPGKGAEHQKMEASKARICDRLDVPSYWIGFEALTGQPEALFFEPLGSFDEMGQSRVNWRRFYSTHPDLARLQDESDSLLANEQRMVAARREDLGYRSETIDLAKARFLRITEVHLFPGHEPDLVEALKTLADGSSEVNVATPWAVYQVEFGAPTPTFFVFMPMNALNQNDDPPAPKANEQYDQSDQGEQTEQGQQSAGRLEELVPDSYSSAETNLYAIRPEMSHVSKEFAAGDPLFWRPKVEPDGKPDSKAAESPSNKRP